MKIPDKGDVRVYENLDELSRAAANDFVIRSNSAIQKNGKCCVALSGGNTPKSLFQVLSVPKPDGVLDQIDWQRIHLFWGDERYVSKSSSTSNFRMTQEYLLLKVPIPKENVHPIPTKDPDPEVSAANYEDLLKDEFGIAEGELPIFDVIYLGLGPDGHTASLFSGTKVVQSYCDGTENAARLVASAWVEEFKMYRITLTPSVINNAWCVQFLISGADKSETLKEVIKGAYRPDKFPAQLINPTQGELIWYLDKQAAQALDLP